MPFVYVSTSVALVATFAVLAAFTFPPLRASYGPLIHDGVLRMKLDRPPVGAVTSPRRLTRKEGS